MKRKFLILGDNNFWYDTLVVEPDQNADEKIRQQVEFIKENQSHYEADTDVNMLYVYEVGTGEPVGFKVINEEEDEEGD